MKTQTKIIIFVIFIISILISVSPTMILKPEARAPDNILHVDQAGTGDFLTIQSAINESATHDTIYVHNGVYYENINIDKSIVLKGESTTETIIDGSQKQSVITISSDNVSVTGLTIRHSGQHTDAGIKVNTSNLVSIMDCNLHSNYYGIWLFHSSDNTVSYCDIHDNNYGLLIHSVSTSNTVTYCHINDNAYAGISICCSSTHNTIQNCDFTSNTQFGIDVSVAANTIYLNNFIDNGIDNGLNARGKQANHWDLERKGNYWSDYDEPEEGAYDTDGDGIVDSPHVIPEENYDYYPFINQIDRGSETGEDTPGFLLFGFLLGILIVFLAKKYH
jgi:parallel beta-helix repeat protein